MPWPRSPWSSSSPSGTGRSWPREPIWVYVVVLVVPMLCSVMANRWYAAKASVPRLHLRVAAAATSVTVVIYLSGWGPVSGRGLRHHRRREHRPVRVEGVAGRGAVDLRGHRLRPVRHRDRLGTVVPEPVPGPERRRPRHRGELVRHQDGGRHRDCRKSWPRRSWPTRRSIDPLTGLPNRLLLVDRLHQGIARARRSRTPFPVVMYLDLDRFKLVNDSCGHSAGDAVLVQVAERLTAVLRDSDAVARSGGTSSSSATTSTRRDLVLAFAQAGLDVLRSAIRGDRALLPMDAASSWHPGRGGLQPRRTVERCRLGHVLRQDRRWPGQDPGLRQGHQGHGPRTHHDGIENWATPSSTPSSSSTTNRSSRR